MKPPATYCINPAMPTDSEQRAMALYTCRLLLSPIIPKARGVMDRDCLFPLLPFLVWPDAIARRYACQMTAKLNDGDEVAFLPPFAGG